ncbi:MAG: tetratricopeptide repeat protein [Acidobacteria bacterium]|nr:tetratricopeptide repeat protein [Acidobacteriota bacterium]
MRIVAVIFSILFLPILSFAADKPISIGQSLESRLDDNSLKRDGVAYETWVFTGKANDLVVIEMSSNKFDSVLKLLSSDGNLIAVDDNGGYGYNSRIVTRLVRDGNYLIEATTVWQMRGGNYRLSLNNTETVLKTGEEKLKEDLAYFEQCLVETKEPNWASELHIGRLLVLSEVRADKQAIEAAELAVVLADQSGDKFTLARAYLAITNRLLRDEEYEGAIKYFEQVAQIQKDLKNRAGEASTLSALADAYLSSNKFLDSRKYHTQALEVYKELKDRRSEGFALFGIAQSYRLERKPKEAIPYYNQALAVARDINNRSGEGYALFGLADCYLSLEDFDQMFSSYDLALKASQTAKDSKLQGIILAALADVYRAQGKFDKAIPYYEQNLAARRQTNDLRGQAYTLNALAVCERNLSKFDSAIKHYEEMLKLCKETKDKRGESIASLGLGIVYKSLSQTQSSINAYEQALMAVREIKDRRGEYTALTGLGIAYTTLNQPNRALPYLEQALVINQENSEKANPSTLLEALANASFTAGQFAQAANYCEKVLNIKQEAKDKIGEANTLLLLAAISAKQGDLDKVANSYEKAKEIFLELKNPIGAYSCRYGLAKLATQRGDIKNAQVQYEIAINIIENNNQLKVENTFGLVTPLQVYESYLEMLASQQQFPLALTVAEKIRIFQFRNLLPQSVSNKEDKATIEFFNQFTAVSINEITQTSQRLNTTILAYLPIESGLLIWAIKPDGTIVSHLNKIDSKRLDSLLDERRILREGKNIRADKMREVLGETVSTANVTANVDEELKTFLLPEIITNAFPIEAESKLLIIASGKLGTMSFADLKDGQGTYLIDKFIVLQSPSLSTFAIANRIRSKSEALPKTESVAFGIPTTNTFNGVMLPTLSDAKSELKAVSNIKSKTLSGVMATKGNLCEQGKGNQFLHIIAYSYLNDKEPLKSFLLLNPQTDEQGNNINNGETSLADLRNCIENNNLVIFSANQNNFNVSNGNGLFFLANTLAINNNSGMIFTLWQVEAKVTTAFSEAFYSQFKKTPDVAVSYRRAVLKVREKFKNPAQWGAFVFIGEPVN